MSKYLVFDRETENHEVNKRFAAFFSPLNWTVALGWKKQGDERCSWAYYPTKDDEKELQIDDDVTLLVGHNLKFDLLYGWDSPQLKAFLKRGGKIWCTQYAEYLIQGQTQKSQMCAMDDIIESYGGRKKIDEVKALWEAGYLTSDIDKDLLIDYLVGTEEEQRNSGDIGNTELILLGQIVKAEQLGMMKMIQARMDGLLSTTEMEFNGLKIDVEEAKRRMIEISEELDELTEKLEQYIPDVPEEFEFNWNSIYHKSALIFGGTAWYEKQATYIDEKTGELARKTETQKWPLFDGEPVNPDHVVGPEDGVYYSNNIKQDCFTSGKNKGEPKFRNVKVPGELKTKKQRFYVEFPGYTTPEDKWKSSVTDCKGGPVYGTGADIIEELGSRDIPFLKDLSRKVSLDKDLGTYYLKYDPKSKAYKGMLTCVRPDKKIVHHNLNHTITVTTRLSSSNPNLQNIPRADEDKDGNAKSEVKKMFVSRFGPEGRMLEIDYSQLEVVIQGMLSGDKQLCEDLRNRVDFHCKRVSTKYGITYEEAVRLCKKDEDHPDHKLWKQRRTDAKVFSFQRAYGAGARKISESTGIPIQDVEEMIALEELTYPDVVTFNNRIAEEVNNTAEGFYDPEYNQVLRRGYFQVFTGTRYSFTSKPASDWQKDKGIQDSFMPTELKNYPVQGTGGEVVQIILGRLYRHFLSKDNYEGKALLCNTVHDCVWFDVHESVLDEVARDAMRIMQSVPEVLEEIFGVKVDVPFPCEAEVGNNLFDKKVIHV